MELNETLNNLEFRSELKSVISSEHLHEFLNYLKLNEGGFRPIYPERRINNIYIDVPSFSSAIDNLDGVKDRVKYRLRWYGNNLERTKRLVFEVKIKKNSLGTKLRFEVPDISLKPNISSVELKRAIYDSNMQQVLKNEIEPLKLSLLNSYKRMYFGAFNKKVIVTIDRDLSYRPFSNVFGPRITDHRFIVIEIKYLPADQKLVTDFLSDFPARLTRHSKYVNGLLGQSGVYF